MWHGMTKYSFDSAKPIYGPFKYGPFKTEEEAWEYIEKMADEEYRIDTEENGWNAKITKNKTCNEITIKGSFSGGTEVTEFFIFKIDNTKLM